MRTVDINTARTFLQKTFLDREIMMSKEQLIELVVNDVPSEQLPVSTHNERGGTGVDQWFEISDSLVRPVRLHDVYSKEAYLLFYERVH